MGNTCLAPFFENGRQICCVRQSVSVDHIGERDWSLPSLSALTVSRSQDDTIRDEMIMKNGIDFCSCSEGSSPESHAS